MPGKRTRTDRTELRTRAEEQLNGEGAAAPARPPGLPAEDRLLHELQIHKIELELQNEELRRAYAELEEAGRLYAELYEFAPTSYFSLDRLGAIVQCNLAGSFFLGATRSDVVGKRFRSFVTEGSRKELDQWLAELFGGRGGPGTKACELELQPVRGPMCSSCAWRGPWRPTGSSAASPPWT